MSLVNQYLDERKKWAAMDYPIRSPERIKELFQICKTCENFKEVREGKGKCGICGCGLKETGKVLNKLAWSTTRCPLEEPKWAEEDGYDAAAVEAKIAANMPEQKKAPSKGGCGCGKK